MFLTPSISGGVVIYATLYSMQQNKAYGINVELSKFALHKTVTGCVL